MPRGRTHPAAERVYPNVDHVQAFSVGGTALELANLITACTPCNERKGDRLGWAHVELERDDWNGLIAAYGRLLEIAGGSITPTHRDWMRALSI
jgi:hypothetical protein